VKDEAGKTPEWNEQFTIPLESLTDEMRITCYESDYLKDDFIGDTVAQIGKFINLAGFKKWVPINY
jgi:Ca2+-dependent lipid-binding protein